jgi:nucleoside-diphosphate-sugar epimerase
VGHARRRFAVYVLIQTVTTPQSVGTGDFVQAERAGLAAIVEACRRQGVGRLLTVGLIGADPEARNAWVRARGQNDRFLLTSGLAVTILRAGLIAGIGGVGFDGVLAAAGKGVAKIRGTGRRRWSYIAVEDLVGYLVAALDEPDAYGKAFDVGSTEAPTYRELIERTSAALRRPPPSDRPRSLDPARTARPGDRASAASAARRHRAALDHLADDLVADPLPVRSILPRHLHGWEDVLRLIGPAAGWPPVPGRLSPDLGTSSRSRNRRRTS